MIYDILIIGGGVLGTCIARDAAMRGLSVALFEREDFGAGMTARGSRIVSAGLRALETLDFTRVREELREREILLQIAPHLVVPQSCLIPFYGQSMLVQTRLRASLALTDALGFDKSLPLHQMLSATETLDREPGLQARGLTGAALVWEAHIPLVERLPLETALDARNHGTALHTHTQVTGLLCSRRRMDKAFVAGVRWVDNLTGETGETESHLVVNAAGAWLPDVDTSLPMWGDVREMRRKCVSVASGRLAGSDALFFPREGESDFWFVTPWQGWSLIGSQEFAYSEGDPAAVYAGRDEVASLLTPIREHLPDALAGQPAFALSGVRVAPPSPGPPAPPDAHLPLVIDHASGGLEGLLSTAGGRLLSSRSLAEEIVDLICRKLGRSLATPPCRTAAQPLAGASTVSVLSTPISGETSALQAAVRHSVEAEECRTLRDFVERRTPLFWQGDQGRASVPLVCEAMAALLGWDTVRQKQEVRAWEADVALTQAFRVM